MFQIHRKTVFVVWCLLMLCASGQNADSNSGKPLDGPDTPRFLGFLENDENGGPWHPMSPEMATVQPSQLEYLSAEDLAKMTLDDPVLKRSYVEVFFNSFEQLEPQQQLVLADMRRREFFFPLNR